MKPMWIRRTSYPPLGTQPQSVVSRLVNRFLLSSVLDLPQDVVMSLTPTVQPVTVMDETLRVGWMATVKNNVDPGGTGFYTLDQVNATKRRRLHAIEVGRSAGATMTFSGIALYDGTTTIRIMTQGAANPLITTFSHWIPVEAQWQIQVQISAYGAGDKLTAYLLWEDEDAY